MIHGRYGEYKVLVDGETVIDGGALVTLGVVPASKKVVDAVRARLRCRTSLSGREFSPFLLYAASYFIGALFSANRINPEAPT